MRVTCWGDVEVAGEWVAVGWGEGGGVAPELLGDGYCI